MIVEVGYDALLQISVTSNPPSKITWEFNEILVDLESMDEGRSFSQLEDGSLQLIQATLDDTGNWTVIADNYLGQIERKQIMLEVTPHRRNVTV